MLHALRDKSADYCNCNSSNKPLRCKVGARVFIERSIGIRSNEVESISKFS